MSRFGPLESLQQALTLEFSDVRMIGSDIRIVANATSGNIIR
jgi:hypothetical protein